MKASSRKREDGFYLAIKMENNEEAQALYAIFNYAPNADLLPCGAAEKIKNAIGEDFYITRGDEEIANGTTYDKFYRRKVPYEK